MAENIDLSKGQMMSTLKESATLSEEKVESTAKKIFKSVVALFVTIFTGLFGAIISQAGNLTISFMAFGMIVLAGVFLYFYVKSRIENSTLKKEQVVWAKREVGIVDQLNSDFRVELKKTMSMIEEKYSSTITGLTCQINDLVVEMCEERDKLAALITVMTTDYKNGIDIMTTEEGD